MVFRYWVERHKSNGLFKFVLIKWFSHWAKAAIKRNGLAIAGSSNQCTLYLGFFGPWPFFFGQAKKNITRTLGLFKILFQFHTTFEIKTPITLASYSGPLSKLFPFPKLLPMSHFTSLFFI